jgi:hypothetical protein
MRMRADFNSTLRYLSPPHPIGLASTFPPSPCFLFQLPAFLPPSPVRRFPVHNLRDSSPSHPGRQSVNPSIRQSDSLHDAQRGVAGCSRSTLISLPTSSFRARCTLSIVGRHYQPPLVLLLYIRAVMMFNSRFAETETVCYAHAWCAISLSP